MAELTKDELLEQLFIAKTGNAIDGRIAFRFAKQGITDNSWVPVEQRPSPSYVTRIDGGDPGPIMRSWLGALIFWAPIGALLGAFAGAFFTGNNATLGYCAVTGYILVLLRRCFQGK